MDNIVRRAKAFAIEAHKDTRYGDLPYEYHLKAVVEELRRHGWDSEEVIAAAWLHDVVEDTHVTLHDIRTEFGCRVARLVDCVTDGEGPNRKARKEAMYNKMVLAPVAAAAIKLADRIANTVASMENPSLSAMYRKEFPEFMIRVGGGAEELDDLCNTLFWLYLDSVLSSQESS